MKYKILAGTLILAGIVLLMFSMNGSATDIIVDPNGNGDYTTMYEALENCTNGDTVYVWDGEYTDNVSVNKSVSVIGNSTSTVILNATGTSVFYFVDILAEYANVSGFSIIGIDDTSAIRLHESDNICISDIRVVGESAGTGVGITINSTTANTDVGNMNIQTIGNGILITDSGDAVTCHNNTINDTTIGVRFVGNTAIVRDSRISNYTAYGFFVSSNDNQAINNVIENGVTGIFIQFANDGIYINNRIANNTVSGISIANVPSSSGNLIYSNDFINNNVHAYSNSTSNTWNQPYPIGGNYWSNWTSPDSDGNGFVDIPLSIAGTTGAIDYYPLAHPLTLTRAPDTSHTQPSDTSSGEDPEIPVPIVVASNPFLIIGTITIIILLILGALWLLGLIGDK